MGVEVAGHLVARLLESERITNCLCFKAFSLPLRVWLALMGYDFYQLQEQTL